MRRPRRRRVGGHIEPASRHTTKRKAKKRRQKVVARRAREIFSGIYLDGEESGAAKEEEKEEEKVEEEEKESHGVEREIRASRRSQVEDSGRTEKKSIPTRRGTPTSFKRAGPGTRPTEGADSPLT